MVRSAARARFEPRRDLRRNLGTAAVAVRTGHPVAPPARGCGPLLEIAAASKARLEDAWPDRPACAATAERRHGPTDSGTGWRGSGGLRGSVRTEGCRAGRARGRPPDPARGEGGPTRPRADPRPPGAASARAALTQATRGRRPPGPAFPQTSPCRSRPASSYVSVAASSCARRCANMPDQD